MTTSVSSVFSKENTSDDLKIKDNVDLNEIIISSSSKPTPLLTSVFNNCYTKALLLLHNQIEQIDIHPFVNQTSSENSYNVTEDDFDGTVFPTRNITPTALTISQSRHEQSTNERFHRLLYSLVANEMYKIVLRWINIELRNEEERASKNYVVRDHLKDKLDKVKSMEKSIDVQQLYNLCGTTKDILIENVDWKLMVTKMRRDGGFKYFDEFSLKNMWIHRCQFGLENRWLDEDDELLDELVKQYGYGKWIEIAEHETFQKKKKSAFMCAQRFMIRSNTSYSKRSFTTIEKETLLSMYKSRCSIKKDYRFCVSHAAYELGNRGIREITHVWSRLNPEIQKGPFTAEEDAILLREVNGNPPSCWTILASAHLPDRSGVQCQRRYLQLTKHQSTQKSNKQTTRKKKSDQSKKYLQWFHKQSESTQNFLEQFYPKNRMTQLQQSIISMNSNKIDLLMDKLEQNSIQIKKCLPLRDLTLKLNQPAVTIDEIYAKFVNNM